MLPLQAYEFLLDLLKMLDVELPAPRARPSDGTASVLFRQLNRMIIWHVSNPSTASDMDLVFVLHSLLQNERLIFSINNSEQEFIPVLCYHLFKLFLDDTAELRDGARHVRFGSFLTVG